MLQPASLAAQQRTKTVNTSSATFLPAPYTLSATRTGFRATKIIAQEVKVNVTSTVNIRMEIGSVTETIEVSATNAELQTANATIGNTVTGIALDALPSIAATSTFVTLQPGVAPDGSVAGAVYDQNSFQLDGGKNTNDMDGSMNIYTPSFAGDRHRRPDRPSRRTGNPGGGPTGVMPTPPDSIEEFKVSTTNQTADFNSFRRRPGFRWSPSAAPTSGTAPFTSITSTTTGPRTPWTTTPPAPRPSFHYIRFGAAGGGPIIPKKILGGKTYFFANYQGFRWPNSETINRRPDRLHAPGSAVLRRHLLQPESHGCHVPTASPIPAFAASCDPRGLGINPTVQQLCGSSCPSRTSPVATASPAAT